MKKTTSIISSIIVAVIIILAAVVVYFFIINKSKIQEEQVVEQEEVIEYLNQEGDTSYQLINADLEAGNLDQGTALLYKMYAIHGDEQLPEKYIGAAPSFEDDYTFAEAREAYDSLSDEQQTKLDPFLKRPNDPESYFNLNIESVASDDFKLIKEAQARMNTYSEFVETADKKIKIWYPSTDTYVKSKRKFKKITLEQAKSRAENLKGILDNDKLYTKFKNLLEKEPLSDGSLGGDNKLDIYLVGSINSNDKAKTPIAVTIADTKAASSSAYIYYSLLVEGEYQKAVLAHELFHAFQMAFNVPRANNKENQWWLEATATWAEDYAYPDLNYEQDVLNKFINYPKKTLPTIGNKFHYGSYIFPFYLTDGGIKNLDYLKRSFNTCGASCITALDKIIDGGFNKQWKEFTLWNWNKTPIDNYVDRGGWEVQFSTDNSKQNKKVALTTKGEQEIEIDALKPLSSQLVIFENKVNSKIKRIDFKNMVNFSDETLSPGIKALVFPKNNGVPYDEDWTNETEKVFCLDDPKQNFERVVLIFSHGEMTSPMNISKMHVESKEQNCIGISQEDKRTGSIELYAMNPDLSTQSTIQSEIIVNSEGIMLEPAKAGAKYGYLTKWEVELMYEEQAEAYDFYMNPKDKVNKCTTTPGKTTHTAKIQFDLSSTDSENDVFPIEVKELNVTYDPWNVACTVAGVTVNESTEPIEYDNIKFGGGVISDLQEQSARIALPDSFAYGEWPYRMMDHIILNIRRIDEEYDENKGFAKGVF